jgi:hypothetical protein
MAYVKAIAWSILAPLGIAAAVVAVVIVRLQGTMPADRATVLAATVAESMNCVALFTPLLLSIAIVNAFLSRRERRRRAHSPR